MKKYFAYIRVSTVKQGERGSSLVEQRSAIEAYAVRQGLSIAAWFEETETAAKQGRRTFSQMLAELNARKADGLIIHKIDRSARNLRDWADLGDLIDHGVDVRFVSDNFDLLSRGGRLSADIQAVVAADFIRNLRDEVKKGMYGRLKQGIYPFAAPIGYLNCGKGKPKAIDPVKGPLVRQMFERYATSSIGFEQLRHEMWEKGLRTSAGKAMYDHTLTAILNNPFYAGIIRLGTTGETFEGAHEPLVSKALFERVQLVLRGKTVAKAKKHRFLFRQMVRCEKCKSRTLTGELQKGHHYYRCHGCSGVSWRGDVLEAVVLAHVARIRFDVGEVRDIGDLVEKEYREYLSSRERLKVSLTLRLQHLDDRITRLTDLLIDAAIDQPTFTARKERLLWDRRGIVDELKRADCRSPLQNVFEEFERENIELLRYESLLDCEKREVIDIICSNFSVYEENPTITLRSPYFEIAKLDEPSRCAHHRGDVRTKQIFDILRILAEKQTGNRDGFTIAARSPRSPQRP